MIKKTMKRNVVSISVTASIRDAGKLMSEKHIGMLPVVDANGALVGVIGLPDILSLELPAFFNLIADVDFIHDFGAVETTRPTPEQIDQPITNLMQPAVFVEEDCGMLQAYGLMLKHNLTDILVVSKTGRLIGIMSRVDIGAAILSTWDEIGASNS